MKRSFFHLVLVLLLNIGGIGHAPYFPDDPPDPSAFARAVNYYVALGEKRAVKVLTHRARIGDSGIEWLCLALFEPRAGGPNLEPPGIGICSEPFVVGGKVYSAGNSKNWPLFPLARAGKTYFVLAQQIVLTGVAETPEHYLAECRAHGVFRTQPVPVPTRAEAIHDAQALRRSAPWRSLPWKGKTEGSSWDISESEVWKEMLQQAETVKDPR